MTDIRAAAEAIASARRTRTPLAPLAADVAPQTEAEGYLVQDALHDLLAADFGARVGYKIGCTSAVMQQYLVDPASLRRRRVRQGRSPKRRVAALRAISSASASNAKSPCGSRAIWRPPRRRSRPSGWRRRSRPICRRSRSSTTAMSNGRRWARRRWSRTISSPPAACSEHPCARSAAPDLLEVIGRAVINGNEVGQGTGADVLGHPHHALAWLANHLAAGGKGLARGRDRADRQPGQDGVAQRRRRGGDGAGGAGEGGRRVRLKGVPHRGRLSFARQFQQAPDAPSPSGPTAGAPAFPRASRLRMPHRARGPRGSALRSVARRSACPRAARRARPRRAGRAR